ncbi:MAG: sugar ABC transporter permease [Anaerolineae bacterium]|nr:sugar ABC transporter permease [Anaerolineae bacterium]
MPSSRSSRKGLYLLSRYRLPYLLLLPAVVVLVVFLAWPLGSIFYFSLRETPLGGASIFVGLDNFALLLSENRFLNNLAASLRYLVGVLALSVPLAYLAAILVSSRLRGAGIFRTVFMLPWIIAPVVSSILFRTMVDPYSGPITAALEWLTGEKFLFLVKPDLAVLSIVVHSAWRSFPFEMLLIAAGLTAISPELYDSAKVDGAGAWSQFRYVTLPLTRNQLFVAVLLITIWTLQDAEGVYSLTQGGPGYVTEVAGVRLFKEAFIYFNIGIGSAIGVVLILLSILFMILYLRVIGAGESQ